MAAEPTDESPQTDEMAETTETDDTDDDACEDTDPTHGDESIGARRTSERYGQARHHSPYAQPPNPAPPSVEEENA